VPDTSLVDLDIGSTDPDNGHVLGFWNEPFRILASDYDETVDAVRLAFREQMAGQPNPTAAVAAIRNNINALAGRFTLKTPLSSTVSFNASEPCHGYNSIAFADYSSPSGEPLPAWLKNTGLRTESFVVSDAPATGQMGAWHCTSDGASDAWAAETKGIELDNNAYKSNPTVAARGLRVPRYAARGDILGDSGSGLPGQPALYSDGEAINGTGQDPLLETNRQTFLDQYLLAVTPGTVYGDRQYRSPWTGGGTPVTLFSLTRLKP
jgi:hypothetical protein